jgi:dihydrofolate synthase/folylpolyglutamate synthase
VNPASLPPRTLQQWLDYQLGIHPRSIELGLARVGEVWRRLGAPRPAPLVITVAGTNGKGSTVAFLEAMLAAGGYRVGAYTSPHILAYNERVRIVGADADDHALTEAFARIDTARGDTALTYFEFGTLAALLLFADAALDVAVLEVGLGGRLDAVNLVDADVAIVTGIALDHQDWLGSDRDSIGREKAGVARPGRPFIVAEADPPAGLLQAAAGHDAVVLRAGTDFTMQRDGDAWRWRCGDAVLPVPSPQLAAGCQPANAAAAITALHCLRDCLPLPMQAIARGVATAAVPARLQRVRIGAGELVIDVAHNPQAARVLADWLAQQSDRPNLAVFGALSDKDLAGMLQPLQPHIAEWHLVDLAAETERGRDLLALETDFSTALGPLRRRCWGEVATALDTLAPRLHEGARVIAFGSFYIAAAALRWLQRHATT